MPLRDPCNAGKLTVIEGKVVERTGEFVTQREVLAK
jgi:hypothetical protein